MLITGCVLEKKRTKASGTISRCIIIVEHRSDIVSVFLHCRESGLKEIMEEEEGAEEMKELMD